MKCNEKKNKNKDNVNRQPITIIIFKKLFFTLEVRAFPSISAKNPLYLRIRLELTFFLLYLLNFKITHIKLFILYYILLKYQNILIF